MKVITIANSKGGCGKSLICGLLARLLSSSASVAIIDLDHQGSLYRLTSNFQGIDVYPATTSIEEILSLPHSFKIIDTAPFVSKDYEALAKMSDVILIPTKVGLIDTIAINNTIDKLKSFEMEEKILIILNMVKTRSKHTDDIYRELKKLGVAIAKTRITDLVDYNRAILNNGVLGTKANYQIEALTREVLVKLI